LVLFLVIFIATDLKASEGKCKIINGRYSTWRWCPNKLTKLPLKTIKERFYQIEVYIPYESPIKYNLKKATPTDIYFNWHDLNGIDWMTGVRYQGECGSCFVFSTVAAIEGKYKYLIGDPLLEIDLSEQSVISCITFGNCENGGFAEEVAHRIKHDGITDEWCYPYIEADGNCEDLCNDWTERRSFITDWHISWLPWDEDSIKAELLNGPIVVNMRVYDDFLGYSGGVYSRSDSAQEIGWHNVTLVGWDDRDNSWIAKNSWGEWWGENGYFKISREPDCGFALSSGVCFASHLAYFDINREDTPGVPCVDTHRKDIKVRQGEIVSKYIYIINCGYQYGINWHVEDIYNASWLELEHTQGYLAPSEQDYVELVIDTRGISPGEYYTQLKVYGGAGINQVDINLIVDEPETPLEVDFIAYPVYGNPPLTVRFAPIVTKEVVYYYWDFGDGQHSYSSNPIHTYLEPGYYTVSLVVEDEEGERAEKTKEDFIYVVDNRVESDGGQKDILQEDIYGTDIEEESIDDIEVKDIDNNPESGATGCSCEIERVNLEPISIIFTLFKILLF